MEKLRLKRGFQLKAVLEPGVIGEVRFPKLFLNGPDHPATEGEPMVTEVKLQIKELAYVQF